MSKSLDSLLTRVATGLQSGELSIEQAKSIMNISPVKRSEKITVKLREAHLTFSEMFYFLNQVLELIPSQKSTEAVEELLNLVNPNDEVEVLKIIALIVDKLRTPGNYSYGLSFSKRYCQHEKILEELANNTNFVSEFIEYDTVNAKDLF
jgi:DNA-directed RNA polymerase subunit F